VISLKLGLNRLGLNRGFIYNKNMKIDSPTRFYTLREKAIYHFDRVKDTRFKHLSWGDFNRIDKALKWAIRNELLIKGESFYSAHINEEAFTETKIRLIKVLQSIILRDRNESSAP
jgi:hypothetical protein